MNKRWSILTAVIVGIYMIHVSGWIVFAVSAVDTNVDFIIIDYTQIHGTDQFTPVPFTHKRHYVDYEIPCRGCHHAWTLEVRDNPMQCKECHRGKIVSDAILLRNAFHRCCMNCHRDLRKQKKPTGPTGCKECHIVSDKNPRRSE